MLVSRQVKADLTQRPIRLPYRTSGLYGHIPKFWNCRTYRWEPSSKFADDPEFMERMRADLAKRKAEHENCRIPWHVSYVGYLAYVFPEGKKWSRIVWWYMGNPYRDKRLEFQENHKWN